MVTARRDTILPLVPAGAGAAPMPESMTIVAEQLGATVARPEQPAVRELALVHRAGPLSPAATRFTELPIPVGTSGDLMRPSEPMPGSGCGWHRHPYPSKPMDIRVDSR